MKITRLDSKTQKPTADTWSLSRDCRQLTIGRIAPADILLDSPDISPRHAELSWLSGTLTIRDLASINGVLFRNSRILHATLQDKDVFTVGGISFQVAVEPDDLSARRSRLLVSSGVSLGILVVLVLALAFIRDAHNAAPEAPPQEPTPILPPVTDPAFQKLSDQYEEASDLLYDSRRLIANGQNDLQAAQLLTNAIALNPNLPQATLLLKGLQETHGARIQQQIDQLIATGRFQDALSELERQKALVGSTNAVQETQTKIDQRIQYQSALQALDQGDLDTAESTLANLSPDLIPERQAALDRLAQCRKAVAWAAQLEALSDQNDWTALQLLADQESSFIPYLPEDALSEVRGALARAQALQEMQTLIASGNAYILVRYIDEIPNLSAMLQPLRDSLAPQAASLRQTADAEIQKATTSPVPVDLNDALASYAAAQAYASLLILQTDSADLRAYRLHSERWNAYLSTIQARAAAYIERGAREEARAILNPLLPHLDGYDTHTYPLRSLATQITPVPFTPETASLLGTPSAPASTP